MDAEWWCVHARHVRSGFRGSLYTQSTKVPSVRRFKAAGNSGATAILLAEHLGASRIILIGYDCHKRGGAHWHGDHPKGLGNAGSIGEWPEHFRTVAERCTAEVVNCSPGTALRCFRQGNLGAELST